MTGNRGITLIELLMVIVLVGILAAVAIPNFIDFSGDAKEAVTRTHLIEIKKAIVGDPSLVSEGSYLKPGYESHMGRLPVDPNPGVAGDDLTELVNQGSQPDYDPFTKTGWRGPYLSTSDPDWNRDAWGQFIRYSESGRTLSSYGPDGSAGGGDDIVVNF